MSYWSVLIKSSGLSAVQLKNRFKHKEICTLKYFWKNIYTVHKLFLEWVFFPLRSHVCYLSNAILHPYVMLLSPEICWYIYLGLHSPRHPKSFVCVCVIVCSNLTFGPFRQEKLNCLYFFFSRRHFKNMQLDWFYNRIRFKLKADLRLVAMNRQAQGCVLMCVCVCVVP